MNKIKLQDIADKLNLSTATVSRALNNSSSIKSETKQLVLQAVETYNYTPLRKLSSERAKVGQVILVLVPDISMTFYAMVVKGICDTAQKAGCSVITCVTNRDVNQEKNFFSMLKSGVADGAIVLAIESNVEELIELGHKTHIVQCCEYKERAKNISHVSINNLQAGREAVQHLVNTGHRRIAMLSSDNSWYSTNQREKAYLQILEENNLHHDPNLIIRMSDYDYTSGIRGANQLLSMNNVPTAIFAISDFMAIGAIHTIQKSGRKVPDDIAVMGFDDVHFASMFTPSLSTIYQPQHALGSTACEILLNNIDNKSNDVKNLYLEHELYIRNSTVK